MLYSYVALPPQRPEASVRLLHFLNVFALAVELTLSQYNVVETSDSKMHACMQKTQQKKKHSENRKQLNTRNIEHREQSETQGTQGTRHNTGNTAKHRKHGKTREIQKTRGTQQNTSRLVKALNQAGLTRPHNKKLERIHALSIFVSLTAVID